MEGELAHTSPCSALGVVQSPWDNRDMAVHEETAGGEGRDMGRAPCLPWECLVEENCSGKDGWTETGVT